MVLNDPAQIPASRQKIQLDSRRVPVGTLLLILAKVDTKQTNKQTPQTFFFPGHESALSFSENGLLQEETRVQNLTGNSAILSLLSSVWSQPYSEGQCPSVPLSTGLRRIQIVVFLLFTV